MSELRKPIGRMRGRNGADFLVVRPSPSDNNLVECVSIWTNTGTMIPKSPNDVRDLFDQDRAVVLFKGFDNPISHAAGTYKYPTSIEVGALCTDPSQEGQGGGTAAARAAVYILRQDNPGIELFALANKQSLPILTGGVGGTIIENPSELDDEVWNYCVTDCPVYKLNPKGKDFSCCDTPVRLTNIQADILPL